MLRSRIDVMTTSEQWFDDGLFLPLLHRPLMDCVTTLPEARLWLNEIVGTFS
jgi:hypothetical protein